MTSAILDSTETLGLMGNRPRLPTHHGDGPETLQESDMLTNAVPAAKGRRDEDQFSGDEHLRPAWQVVVATIAMLAASVLVLAIAG